MRMLRNLFLSFVLLFAASASAQPHTSKVEGGFADLVEKLSPAVVNISTTQTVKVAQNHFGFGMPEAFPNTPEFEPFRQFFDRFNQMQGPAERDVQSLGSGFIMSAEGYVITNNHVVAQADEITVTLSDNRQFSAEVMGRDPKTDLALLKIEDDKPFPFVSLGDSDAMRVGDWVIAIGNPFGLGGSVTQGIISARQRSINAGPFDDFLQTDAPINRGNSGGPLFNLDGQVIGINTAIFSPSGGSVGIGFAIPTALAKPVIAQLKAKGHVVRGWLGVKIQEVSEEVAESLGLKESKGALVLEIGKDSPAAKGGIQQGDIIIRFGGKDIKEMRFLPRMVAETKIGSTVPVQVWRQNQMVTLNITIGKLDEGEEVTQQQSSRSDQEKPKSEGAQTLLGMELVQLNTATRQRFGVPADVSGVVVVQVVDDSPAAKRGVRTGDIILAVNNVPVSNMAGMKKQIENARNKGREFALITIRRGQEEAFVTLPVKE